MICPECGKDTKEFPVILVINLLFFYCNWCSVKDKAVELFTEILTEEEMKNYWEINEHPLFVINCTVGERKRVMTRRAMYMRPEKKGGLSVFDTRTKQWIPFRQSQKSEIVGRLLK